MSELGAPPRAMTEAMRRYLLVETSNLMGVWIACALLFSIGHIVVVGASGSWLMPPILPAVLVGLAVWSGVTRARHRRRLSRVLVEGQLVGAVVQNVRKVEKGRLLTTYVTYRVEGTERDITLASIEPAFASREVGLRDEVLYLREEPDLIVPTFTLA